MTTRRKGKSVTQIDLQKAMEGFTPASLKGVKLLVSDVKWDAIGGLEETRRSLKNILEMPMRWNKLFKRAPIRLPSGVLLYGPPGCGKTMVGVALAAPALHYNSF